MSLCRIPPQGPPAMSWSHWSQWFFLQGTLPAWLVILPSVTLVLSSTSCPRPPPWACDTSCSRTLYSACVLRELCGGCSQGNPKLLFWEAKQSQGCGPCIYAAAKSLQSCLTLCDPIDGSPPGSPVPWILQARTVGWVAMFFSNAWKWKVKVKSLSQVQLLVTPWTAAYQAPPSMRFSRQECWSGVPLPSLPCVCVYIYPNVLFLWRILIESYTSPFESLEESISRVPWPSVGLRSAESGLCKKRHVKFTKVVGHMFLWVLS